MTLSALGIFSAAGAGGVAFSSDYELIQTALVSGSSTSTVTFSSLGTYSSTYKHLQIRSLAKGSAAFSSGNVRLRFNSDTGNNYAIHKLIGANSAVTALASTSRSSTIASLAFNSGTANAFSGGVCDILDAYSASKNKTTRLLSNTRADSTTEFIQLVSGAWFNTASITDIGLDLEDGGNFVAGSRFSIYGIRG
jgi:hypothetical protein